MTQQLILHLVVNWEVFTTNDDNCPMLRPNTQDYDQYSSTEAKLKARMLSLDQNYGVKVSMTS